MRFECFLIITNYTMAIRDCSPHAGSMGSPEIREKHSRRSFRTCDSWWRLPAAALIVVLLPWTTTTAMFTMASEAPRYHPPPPPGAVYPQKLELQIGDDGNITCHITSVERCTRIWFWEPKSRLAIDRESDRIEQLSRNEFMLVFRNASEQMGRYQCMCNEHAIGQAKVYVGTPPLKVVDFVCISKNYLNLSCNFTRPANRLDTEYKLTYTIDNTSYDVQDCPLEGGTYCRLPMYFPNRKIYRFELNATNKVGKRSQYFIVYNGKSVVPALPDKILIETTTDSVRLNWIFHKIRSYDGEQLLYNVHLNTTGAHGVSYEQDYNFANVTCTVSNCSVMIEGLKYANRRYNMSVRVRVLGGLDDERMWSEPFIGHFTTKPRRPDRPPLTAAGGYYIDEMGSNVTLFWHALADYEENGPGFYYALREMDAGRETGTWNTTESWHVMPWRSDRVVEYEVRAGNSIGESLESSTLRVYPRSTPRGHYKPGAVVAFFNQTYTLSWKAPVATDAEMTNYTVFWCEWENESHNHCRSTIVFDYVNRTATNYTIDPGNRTFIMAVSANYRDRNSGMQWSKCSSNVKSELTQLKPTVTAVSATVITVRWELEGVCPSIIEGYNLTYCAGHKCASVAIGRHFLNHTIGGLRPYTEYCVNMTMISLQGLKVGRTSIEQCQRTQEAAPSAPTEFNWTSVTSNSANLTWLAPIRKNGELRRYTIWKYVRALNQTEQTTLSVSDVARDADRLFYKLDSLYSYTEFKVSVTASTIADSPPSNFATFRTLIGTPSKPRDLKTINDGSEGVFIWTAPEMPSGRVEFYAVALTLIDKNDEQIKKISLVRTGRGNVTMHRCRFALKCSANIRSYYLSVRAVNVANQSEIDHGTFKSDDNATEKRLRSARHTSPEIRAAVVNGRPTAPNMTEAPREDATITSPASEQRSSTAIETSTLVIESSSEIIEIANDFQCVGDYDGIEERFMDYADHERMTVSSGGRNDEFKYFSSPWATDGTHFLCYPDHTILWIGLYCLVSLVVCALAYRGQKKWQKMKNIEAKLPVGLVNHIMLNKSSGGGLGGGGLAAGGINSSSDSVSVASMVGDSNDNYGNPIKNTLAELGHSNDWSQHKEFQQLLGRTEVATSTPINSVCLHQKDAAHNGSSASSSGDADHSTSSIDSMELNDMNGASYAYMAAPFAAPVATATDYQLAEIAMFSANGYVSPAALSLPPGAAPQASDASSDVASDILSASPVPSSGYVLPQALMSQSLALQQPDNTQQKPEESRQPLAGYVTFDTLGKAITAPPLAAAPITGSTASPIAAPIPSAITAPTASPITVPAALPITVPAAVPITVPAALSITVPTALPITAPTEFITVAHTVRGVDALLGEAHAKLHAAVDDETLAGEMSPHGPTNGNVNNNNNSNLICGYVTQRQLAELGHLLHEADLPLDAARLRSSTLGVVE